jgi:hypothetical protein
MIPMRGSKVAGPSFLAIFQHRKLGIGNARGVASGTLLITSSWKKFASFFWRS